MTRAWTRGLLSILLVFGVAVFGAACSEDEEGGGTDTDTEVVPTEPVSLGSVDVLGIWGGDELASFEKMLETWEGRAAGGNVDFTGTRDITAVLTTRVEGGNPPDIAIPAELGLFRRFASEGKLTPLEACEGLDLHVDQSYPGAYVDLGTVDGTLYGVFMKADTKGTIWYNPKVFEAAGVEPLTAESTFDDLVALSNDLLAAGVTPWSVGVESGGASGWPGTDWLQQIILNEAGPEVYDGIIDGSVAFTDPAVKDAWEKFGQIIHTDGFVLGGPEGANATGFQESTYPPFEDPPRAAMVYLGGFASGFISEQFPEAVPGEDYDFFPFPGGNVTGGANIAYAFNDDPGTCSLMRHLAQASAQEIWVKEGGFTSVNNRVGLDLYPDELSRKQAEQLLLGSGRQDFMFPELEADAFRFDLDDAIGGAWQAGLFEAVTRYISDPGSLDSILEQLAALRE